LMQPLASHLFARKFGNGIFPVTLNSKKSSNSFDFALSEVLSLLLELAHQSYAFRTLQQQLLLPKSSFVNIFFPFSQLTNSFKPGTFISEHHV
jgi:hypothetical protein